MKPKIIIALLIIVPSLLLGVFAFQAALTPYVPFDRVPRTPGMFQVMGDIDHQSVHYQNDVIWFDITDDHGQRLKISYQGELPSNFSHAKSAVIIGSYAEDHIQAQRLLVKCPSKYQEGQ